MAPYTSYVESLGQACPQLSHLCDFMQLTAMPRRINLPARADRLEQVKKTRVVLLDLQADRKVDELYTIHDLSSALEDCSSSKTDESVYLFIV